MPEAIAMFESLVTEHQKMIAECSGSGAGTFTVGGSLSGLAAQSSVLLQNNGADDLVVAANGQFTFATSLTDGGSYAVTIAMSPIGQSCMVANGSGAVTGADVTMVQVQCTDVPTTVGVPSNPGDLVISEVMPNPTAVTDAMGEWFEIHNPTTTAFELMGLVVRDDGSNIFTVDQSLIIQPGAFLAFGRNADAATNGGATVAFAYSGFTLANASDEIELAVGQVIIDRLAYGAGFPLVAGQAMSLSAASLDDVSNDSGTNWCSAVDPLAGGDLGTPGLPNGTC